MKFRERSPIETGFAEVFDTQIAPQLAELEFEREEQLRRTRIKRAIGGVAFLVAVVLVLRFVPEDGVLLVLGFGSLVPFVGYHAIGYRAETWWEATVKDVGMPAVLSQAGGLERVEDVTEFPFEKVLELGLVLNPYRKRLRYLLRGSYKDVTFQMVHARLSTSDDGKNRSTNNSGTFIGFLFQIDLPNPAPGRISLMRERGAVGNKLAETLTSGFGARSWPKVTFDHPAFEDRFEVYAEEPDAAKAYFTTRMLDGLVDIVDEGGQRPSKVMVGYDGPSFYMALPRNGEDVMPMGKLNAPVTDIQEQIHDIFADIEMAHKVIDRLLVT